MKKSISFILCCVLIFSSFSFVFADFGSGDSTNLYNLYNRTNSIWNYINNYMPTFNQISTISGNVADIYSRLGSINTNLVTLSTISNTLTNIYNALNYGSHTITYWVNSINSWMSPIYNSITNIPVDLSTIIGALGSFDTNNNYSPYLLGLKDLRDTFFNYYLYQSSIDANTRRHNSHTNWVNEYGNYSLPNLDSNFAYSYTTHAFQNGSPLGNIGMILYRLTNNEGITSYRTLTGYNTSQTSINWLNLTTSSFTPQSFADGTFKWLSYIQNPVARLSYVLASDERIEAQEAAAANEEAVVDNFIDSSGDGSASPSDIGSVSDLSSGYKQNFGSDASPSGIFDIFNSDHATWFSQETKNQLDTTTPSRMTKGSVSDTPLLDKQIEDIYNALGVKQP